MGKKNHCVQFFNKKNTEFSVISHFTWRKQLKQMEEILDLLATKSLLQVSAFQL